MSLFVKRPKPEPAGPGQESVWEYPRPPRLETSADLVEIFFGGKLIARSNSTWRVLETSHPPTYYLPHDAFVDGTLRAAEGRSWCEWKGTASYFDVVGGDAIAPRAAWMYPDPVLTYADIDKAVAVMPALMDRCLVNGEVVIAQPGGFYGGWITSRVVGPFKGEPGTNGW